MKQALASMGDLGLRKCTLTSLESRIEVQINEALERIHRFQVPGPGKLGPGFGGYGSYGKIYNCQFRGSAWHIRMTLGYFRSGS